MLFITSSVVMMFFGVVFSADNIPANEIGNDSPISCFTDRDCPETDYCTGNSVCYPCFSCEKLNQERAVRRCAKGPKDCGRCLPGYSQASYWSPYKKVICSPIVTSAEPMTSEYESHFTKNPVPLIGMIVLAVLAIVAFVSWQCYGKRPTTPIHDTWNEMGLGPLARTSENASLPPPSYEDAQRTENGNVAYSFQLRITERPEKQTTAIPFQLPLGQHIVSLAQGPSQQNSNAATASDENASNVPVTESDASFQPPSAIDIHDESTQPSNWTPGAAYLMNENVDETDSATTNKVSPPNKRRKIEEKKPNES